MQGAQAAARAEGKQPEAVLQPIFKRLQHAAATDQPSLEALEDT